jgi:hypothetical protein
MVYKVQDRRQVDRSTIKRRDASGKIAVRLDEIPMLRHRDLRKVGRRVGLSDQAARRCWCWCLCWRWVPVLGAGASADAGAGAEGWCSRRRLCRVLVACVR